MALISQAGFEVYAWEQKNYEMDKCLSLVHLTSTVGPESSGSGQSNSRFLRSPRP